MFSSRSTSAAVGCVVKRKHSLTVREHNAEDQIREGGWDSLEGEEEGGPALEKIYFLCSLYIFPFPFLCHCLCLILPRRLGGKGKGKSH